MSWPTTRRHPRTVEEAFSDADRARWHEGWQRRHERIADVVMAVAIGVALAFVLAYGGRP